MRKQDKQRIWANTALTLAGWQDRVTVSIDQEGRISDVVPDSNPDSGDNRVDALIPAAANLHSHGFQRAIAGLTEYRTAGKGDSFWTWRDLMYRFLLHLDPEDVEAITAYAQVEMLESGYASVGEFHYVHRQPDGSAYDDHSEMAMRILAASQSSGIGLTLLPVLYQQAGCDGAPLSGGQRRFGNSLDDYWRLVEAVEPWSMDGAIGLAPHSLRAVAPDALSALANYRDGRPIHIHIAEQLAELEEIRSAYGANSVAWALDNLPIDAGWCLIHCTHMSEEETRGLARTGAIAGLCPITEANLGDGIFRASEFMREGGKFGVGTDSNISISLFDELRFLEYSQRAQLHSRAVLAQPPQSVGAFLYNAASQNGCEAIGRSAGSIETGRFADLAALNMHQIDLTGRKGDYILDAAIFAARAPVVTDVWAAGRHLVKDGQHLRRQSIETDYRRAIARLLEQL